ncbi:EAL domain-containing protein [Vibrio paucivorans]|uniref:EAL domain-containing protein n=1 Tax=Vibrio paucivorans TaxID=2829489 RepID=A0A9X3CHX3_9VIBR|nr:EAL domain-containing protein [Vibrio paucivorans]MCW8336142.1 EAL domain-containing protein [Vibrio paucivorans]
MIRYFANRWVSVTSLVVMAMSSLVVSPVSAEDRPVHIAIETGNTLHSGILEKVGDELGIEFRYREFTDYSQVFEALDSGQIDIVPGITYTRQRAREYAFSEPVMSEQLYFTYPTQASGEPIDPASVTKVGVDLASVYGRYLRNIDVEVVPYQTLKEATHLLNSGEIDAVISNISQAKLFASENFESINTGNYLPIRPASYITRKSDQDMVELMKLIVGEVIASEQYVKLVEKDTADYIEFRKEAILNAYKRSGISVEQPLRAGIEDYYPYGYWPETGGQQTGLSVELFFAACEILQIRCENQTTQEDTWEKLIEGFKEGEYDVIAPVSITEERRSFMHFSHPFLTAPSQLMRRAKYKRGAYTNVSELVHERVGVVIGDVNHELLSNLLPMKELQLYSSWEEMTDALLAEQVDYIAVDEVYLNSLLRDSPALPVEKAGEITTHNIETATFAFRKTPELEAFEVFFSQALDLVTENINPKYIYVPDWQTLLRDNIKEKERVERGSTLVLIFLVLFLIVTAAAAVLYWRRAHIDAQTGLRNRSYLYQKYSQKLHDRRALAFVHIQNSREISHSYGHLVCDEVAKFVAKKLLKGVPKTQPSRDKQVYRFSDYEFVVACDRSPTIYDRLSTKVSELVYSFNDNPIKVKVAVGIYEGSGLSVKESLNYARVAMLKNRQEASAYRLCDDEILKEYEIETELNQLIKSGEIYQHIHYVYQPKFKDNKCVSAESLVRIALPKAGPISPYFFIRYLEKSNKMLEVGIKLIDINLSNCKALTDRGIKVAVNISAQQFSTENFSQVIHDLCAQHQLDPQDIILEMTETELAESYENMEANLFAVKEMGFRLSLDDFGVGYSSLSYLCQLPLDEVKIDRVFVTDIHSNPPNQQLVKSMVTVAQELGYTLIAEGVETEQEYQWLKDNQVEYYQGYYFSKPKPLDELLPEL